MDERIEHLKDMKEITDIISERDRLAYLLQVNDINGIKKQLESISEKHWLEKAMHNLVNNNPPRTIQEDACNCLSFLDELLKAKGAYASIKQI